MKKRKIYAWPLRYGFDPETGKKAVISYRGKTCPSCHELAFGTPSYCQYCGRDFAKPLSKVNRLRHRLYWLFDRRAMRKFPIFSYTKGK